MVKERWGHTGWQTSSHTVTNNYFLTSLGGRYDTITTTSTSIMTNYEISRIIVIPDSPNSLIREKQTVSPFQLSVTNPLPTSKKTKISKNFLKISNEFMLERWMTSAAKIGFEDLLGYGFYDTAVMIGPGKKKHQFQFIVTNYR